jgi:ribonuclease J
MIVDCGVEFPDAEQLGVDLIIPDVSYLLDKLDKIRGIVITHAHEDHFGALPYVLKDLRKPPIYAAKLVLGFIQNKLNDFEGLANNQEFHEIIPEIDPFDLGNFYITPFRVNHSVPDTVGLFIKTPIGNLVHAADFKFDWTPVDGKQFEVSKLARLTDEGVLLLLSDSLGATNEGYTHSEITIQDTFEHYIEQARGQVFITTISSNISRMHQAVEASRKYGRKVCFVGRSIDQNVKVARSLGYIDFPEEMMVQTRDARNLPPDQVTYIIAGCYAQEGSGLDRVSRQEHRDIELLPDATIIFSADPIPGVYDLVGAMIDRLTLLGATVVYSAIQDNLHVSGHGARGDLSLMVGLTKPKYFMPIGGDPRHQRAYAEMVEHMGYLRSSVFELRATETLLVTPNKVSRGESVPVKDVFVDGSGVGDVGNVVIRDRQILSESGIVVVILQKGNKGNLAPTVDIVSRGFVYMSSSEELIKGSEQVVLQEIKGEHVRNWSKIRENVEKKLSHFLYKQTGRNPMIVAFLANPTSKSQK